MTLAVAKENPIKRFVIETLLAAMAFSATAVLPSITHAGLFNHEEMVQWKDDPPVKQNTITAQADNREVDKVEKEIKGKDEQKIDWNQVPIRVQRAFIRYGRDANIREDDIKIDSSDGITIYEGIADTPDKGTIEMKISPDGKLLELNINEY